MRIYQTWTENKIQDELETIIGNLGKFPAQLELKLIHSRLLSAIYRLGFSMSYFRSKFNMLHGARCINNLNMPELTSIQLEIIEGSLLGDGSLIGSKKYTSRNWYFRKGQSKFDHKKHDKESYMQWHIDLLSPYSKIKIDTGKTKPKKIAGNRNITPASDYYSIRTCAHPIFTELSKKWYANEDGIFSRNSNGQIIKTLPPHIKLTPLMLTIWYCDDGINIPQHRTVVICTDNFSSDEVDILIEDLKPLGISAYQYRNQIKIRSSSYLDFLEIVKQNFNWDCFQYKIDLKKYKHPKPKAKGEKIGISKLTEMKVKKILKEKLAGATYKSLSKKFAVSESTIYQVVSKKTWKHIESA